MTDAQQQAIIRHGRQLLAIFPHCTEPDPVRLCKRLRLIENKANRNNERLCCDENYSERAQEKDDAAIERRTDSILQFKRDGILVVFNGDPRGNALKIDDVWINKARTVTHDGEPVYTGMEPEAWLHRHQSASVDHATRHEGYNIALVSICRDWGGYGIIAPEIDRNGHS